MEIYDICEFISRRGRVELLRIIVRHVGSVGGAAKMLGVNRGLSIGGWTRRIRIQATKA